MIVGRYVKPWSIALIVILLIAVSPIRGISVLCISEMGHLEVEFVGSSCCDQEAAPSFPSVLVIEDAIDDCGTCIDVLFSQEASRTFQRELSVHDGTSLFSSILSIPQRLTGFLGASRAEKTNPGRVFSSISQNDSQHFSVIRC